MRLTSLLDLPTRIAALPTHLQAAWKHMFAFSISTGTLVMPEAMHAWVEHQFGSIESVREQTVVKLVNQLTLEGALFNPARAHRPAMSQSDDSAIDNWVAAELKHDIFARPDISTPADVFGRIHGKFCVTASNIAKYDGWHGVVICDEPHPLHFDREQVRDYVATAWRWIEAAHAYDAEAIYPLITWNCLPKSGASLAHGHLQVALGRGLPYTRIEVWRRAAEQYRRECGRNYFEDFAALHTALGLALPDSGLTRFVHLTPMRNHEIVLIDGRRSTVDGNESSSTVDRPPSSIADALYETLHMLVSTHGVRAFNAAIAFPPLASDGRDWSDVPVFARIGDRGDPLSVRSDIGVMELYGMNVVTVDPLQFSEECRVKNEA